MKRSFSSSTFIEINILICSLIALLPNNLLFKELNIKKSFPYIRQDTNLILVELAYLENLFFLLNKQSIREIAYNILQPLLQEIKNKNKETPNVKVDAIEYRALKKYLQKFKYSYKKCFLKQPFMMKYIVSEKELNLMAIKTLFVLVGT